MRFISSFITDPRQIIQFPVTLAEMCMEFGMKAMEFASKIMKLMV